MRGIIPSDFVAWVSRTRGLRIVAFSKEVGIPMVYDDALAQIKSPNLIIKKPGNTGGALRSPQQDLTDFWKAWRTQNQDERQFIPRPTVGIEEEHEDAETLAM